MAPKIDEIPDQTDEDEDKMLGDWYQGLGRDETSPSLEWPEANQD